MKKRSVPQTPPQRITAKSKKKHPVAALPAQPLTVKSKKLGFVVQALDAFRTDPGQTRQDLIAAFSQAMPETLKNLENKGYQAEVQSYLQLITTAQQQNNRDRAKEIVLKGHSLRSLCRYLDQGEAALFSDLPVFFQLDASFFLKEPWIQDLFARWRQQGEVEKIGSAFAGLRKGNRGRSFKLALENLQRDQKIVAAVTQLLEMKSGYRAAMLKVSRTINTLGISDQLSPAAIRKIYEEWTKPGGIPSFVRFFTRP